MAVPSPFTTVILSPEDELGATLDQINTGTYDRIKLCRSTLTTDGGLNSLGDPASKLGVIISYTGALLFPAFPGVDRSFVLASANRILFDLLLGGIEFDAISPDDIGYATVFGTGYFRLTGGASGPNYSFLMGLQQSAINSFEAIKIHDPRTYTKDHINAALAAGKPFSSKLPELNPSLFLDGLTHLRRRQLPSALVFLWSSAEFLLARIWSDKIVPNGSGIIGRKKFVEGNQWQAAQKVEVLYQVGLIGEETYGSLNEARSARNALAHRGDTPDELVCVSALKATLTLMSLIVSDYSDPLVFSRLTQRTTSSVDPKGPLQPKFWRKILPVPGDESWGDESYPQHPELELVPINEIRGERRQEIGIPTPHKPDNLRKDP